ncbi:DNA-(apurinic or apyrimidinic site) endonuclease [Pectinophora gossypiella]|uniref:DNA-(apurinic or apyrimidinic site) endonuclease n=1 Tax=Pectinophora gossypiella TaxID=13191 RepID=UPI00214F116A|nr:DNA-(apurinic or apyrimidinic site) endonuclease [Pectinophora gossypiella]
MAPRSAKAKKAADVKTAENDAPKKGRGKAKNIEEVDQDLPDVDIEEKATVVTEKKPKRGKKAQDTNGDAQTNGAAEESAPPTKRGRKKNEPAEEKLTNGDNSAEEEPASPEEEQNGDHAESNGNTEESEPSTTGKGRKKQTKKEEKPKETGRGRKAKQASPDDEEKEVAEKPKGKGRGRKAQPKADADTEEDKTEPAEEAKAEPAPKGRKKAPAKTVKEKTPESEKEESEELEKESVEDKTEEVKKETKGRKGKKVQAKEDGEESEAKEEPASKKRKVTKKEEKGKGDSKDEDAEEEDGEVQEAKPAESKPSKGKRGQKKAEPSVEPEEENQDSEATTKRRRKPAEEKAPADDSKKKAPAKNKATTNYEEIDFSNSSKSPQGKEWNFKIASWNVDGIRAWMSKGGLDYIKYEKPDILCLQEVKCSKEKLPDELANLPGYHAYWLGGDKDGYAGVAIYTTQLAMNVQYGLQNEELDDEGRIITAEYEHFYLICTYVPNAGRKLVTLPKRLQWNQEFRKHVQELDKKKPVIICGDMNVAHNEIDLTNPKTNKKNAGFTEEERAGMTELLGDGFIDTYRHFYPDKTGAYTFWTYMMGARAKNVGWRLDYFIVSERLLPSVCDNVIREQVYGSDHCPISLFLHLTTADKPKE